MHLRIAAGRYGVTLNIRTEAGLMRRALGQFPYSISNDILWHNMDICVASRLIINMQGISNAYTDLSYFRALFSCPASLEFVQFKPREHMRFCVENDFREREIVPRGEKEVQILQSFGLWMC